MGPSQGVAPGRDSLPVNVKATADSPIWSRAVAARLAVWLSIWLSILGIGPVAGPVLRRAGRAAPDVLPTYKGETSAR